MEHGELYQYRKISPSQIILHSNSNSIIDLFRKPFNSALLLFPALVLVGFCLDLGFSHSHSHDHDHHHCGVDGHAHALHYHHQNDDAKERTVLPEELAEEEDFKLYGFGYPHHHHHCYSEDKELSGLGRSYAGGGAFLHQLPHDFGGENSHSHDNHADHEHGADSGHRHSHSLSDLSTRMSNLVRMAHVVSVVVHGVIVS